MQCVMNLGWLCVSINLIAAVDVSGVSYTRILRVKGNGRDENLPMHAQCF